MDNNIYANPVGIIKKDIYVIKNDINNKLYVGQSIDVEERFRSHCKNNTDNSLIDDAIQKYGKRHFYYKILESQVENYDEREQHWIKELNSQTPNGYNVMAGGSNPPTYYGDDSPSAKISDEDVKQLKWDLANTALSLLDLAHKYQISKRQILRINQGISRCDLSEHYPIRKNPNLNGKLSEEDVDSIIEILKYTYRFNGDIAREFGVEVHAISRINEGIAHHKENVKYPIRNWKSSGEILFTYEQVTDIIDKLQNTKISIHKLAREYDVSDGAIKNINTGVAKKYRRDNINYPIRPF